MRGSFCRGNSVRCCIGRRSTSSRSLRRGTGSRFRSRLRRSSTCTGRLRGSLCRTYRGCNRSRLGGRLRGSLCRTYRGCIGRRPASSRSLRRGARSRFRSRLRRSNTCTGRLSSSLGRTYRGCNRSRLGGSLRGSLGRTYRGCIGWRPASSCSLRRSAGSRLGGRCRCSSSCARRLSSSHRGCIGTRSSLCRCRGCYR